MSITGLYLEAGILTLIAIVALTGNVSLYLIVFRSRSLQKNSNYFTLNLALADILVSLVNMPVTVYTIIQNQWTLGEVACQALGFVNILSFISSVLSLALIAINRLFFVVYWKDYKRYFRPRRVKFYIFLTWLIALLLSMPPLLGWASFGYVPGKSYCFVIWRENASFAYFMVLVCFFGPLITMGFCYSRILWFTKNAKRKIQNEMSKSTRNCIFRNVSPEESRITNTLLIVLGAFIACWLPFAITMFLDIYYPHRLPRWIDMGSLMLGYINSLCNPIIYSVRNTQFRKAFMELYALCGIKWFKRNRAAVVVSSARQETEESSVNRRQSKSLEVA
ncbi:melatonin receptor type 1B-B-like [Actinia tenebrosa]|uniref:Melatonin receptor type 1B-B-like n=1 Tax=Actinia tenebrosa TaxID=6105 RepID=A0A6P8HI15_ACTTE|nr:melatonin receptor type 1B-B-like [Actinia tenebrosa]